MTQKNDYMFCSKGTNSCKGGYTLALGDIPGNGRIFFQGGAEKVQSCNECGEKCDRRARCLSYECSPTDLRCNLNEHSEPSAVPYKDYMFCTKD